MKSTDCFCLYGPLSLVLLGVRLPASLGCVAFLLFTCCFGVPSWLSFIGSRSRFADEVTLSPALMGAYLSHYIFRNHEIKSHRIHCCFRVICRSCYLRVHFTMYQRSARSCCRQLHRDCPVSFAYSIDFRYRL